MRVEELNINHKSAFIELYTNQDEQCTEFFDYCYQSEEGYKDRVQELALRQFPRHALVQHLTQFNRTYDCSVETVRNIEKLSSENSVVVIGGQQAGVLTGPLYTIHKIITIIKLAKEKERKLGIPVIPVFWVAGEDHDFEEISHIYTTDPYGKVTKQKVSQQNELKKSVSDLHIDHGSVQRFIRGVFKSFKETGETNRLQLMLEQYLTQSNTYVDLFCYVIHNLFKQSGIVLLDSHHPDLRRLEVPFLNKLISVNDLLREAFVEQADCLFNKGFGEPIDRSRNNSHIFFHASEGRRVLLFKQENGFFADRDRQFLFCEDELKILIEREPERFSNNVVTRPLMQEFLFPALAFVAGPGEITYWATLKKAFHLLGFKVPPVVPRLSMTLIDSKVEKYLKTLDIPLLFVFEKGAKLAGEEAIFEVATTEIERTLAQVKDKLKRAQEPLIKIVEKYDAGLYEMAQKNLEIIQSHAVLLGNRVKKSVREKNELQFLKYEIIDAVVVPNGFLQERSLNIFKYLNDYGEDLIKQLLEVPLEMNTKHKVIYL